MTGLPVPTPKTTTYRGAISHVEQIQWERLNEITVADAIFKWLARIFHQLGGEILYNPC